MAAQGLFQRPADLRIAPGGDQHQMPQVQAKGRQAGGIEIGILGDPGRPAAACGGSETQRKQSGPGGALLLVAALAGNLMHGAGRHACFLKRGVDLRYAEGQQAVGFRRTHLGRRNGGDALLQLGKVDPRGHRGTSKETRCSLFVPIRGNSQATENYPGKCR